MAPPRTVLVVTSQPAGPVVRHRFVLFAPALRAAGIELDVGPWPKDGAVRRATLARCRDADAVVVSSRLLARADVRRVRAAARRLGFDFDDALPFRDSAHGASVSRTRLRRFRALVAAADRVTAGNAYLASLAREAGRVATVTPTVVRTPAAPPPAPAPAAPLRLGWIGSRATLSYLEGAAPALAVARAHGVDLCVRSIADAAPRFGRAASIEHVPWTAAGWEAALADTHAGLAPLPDDRWTRGKCGLKVLQTGAVGRPVVASAVGVQRDQVRDGETGFLASDDEAFAAGIVALARDPAAREAMGRAAFEHVAAAWSEAAWAPHVVRETEALLDGVRSAEAA